MIELNLDPRLLKELISVAKTNNITIEELIEETLEREYGR